MSDLLKKLEDMAVNGYGITWSSVHKEYRPFEVYAKDDLIEFWHDPDDCGSDDFETAVRATHKNMLLELGP